MKEMIYKALRDKEILEQGTYKGVEFLIVSYGTHPCAYINVAPKFYHKTYEDIVFKDLKCHYGLTYAGKLEFLLPYKETKLKWFIGWDYCHFDDFYGGNLILGEKYKDVGKKWTTEEIYEEVKEVIDCFIEIRDRNVKYIRTNKNRIVDIDKTQLEWLEDAVKYSETIEDLCDDFILDNGYTHTIENGIVGARRTKQFSIDHGHKVHIYGGIWTEKGFTYVAELNDKGELELL